MLRRRCFFLLCFFRDVFLYSLLIRQNGRMNARKKRKAYIIMMITHTHSSRSNACDFDETQYTRVILSAWLFFSAAAAAALCSRSIQFNSLCAILRAPVCEYIFMYPFMKMYTQPGLTRQTFQETFARCLSFFLHKGFCT